MVTIFEEAVVAYLEMLSRHSLAVTKKNHNNSYPDEFRFAYLSKWSRYTVLILFPQRPLNPLRAIKDLVNWTA